MIDQIRAKVASKQYVLTAHAFQRRVVRMIALHEIEEAIAAGDVIEDYPTDKYGPSCLLFGSTAAGRPLHIQVSYPSRPMLKIITVYEPDAAEWIDFRTRKNP